MTCVVFEEMHECPSEKPHLYFYHFLGCNAPVGYKRWTKRYVVDIGNNCYDAMEAFPTIKLVSLNFRIIEFNAKLLPDEL